MIDKIQIYGQLESGIADGFVTDASQIANFNDGIKLDSKLQVAGHLADSIDWGEWENDGKVEIPQGTSMYAIFKKMLQQIRDGYVNWVYTENEPEISNITLRINDKTSTSYTAEVGSTVTMSYTGGNITPNQGEYVLNHDCGYFENANGVWKDDLKTVYVTRTSSGSNSITYTYDGVTQNNNSITVAEGSKTVSGTVRGTTVTDNAVSASKVFASNNIKQVIPSIFAEITHTTKSYSMVKFSGASTIKGDYYTFVGTSKTSVSDMNSENIRELQIKNFKNSTGHIIGTYPAAKRDDYLYIAVPEGYTLVEANQKSGNMAGQFKSTPKQVQLPNKAMKNYTLYYIKIESNSTFELDKNSIRIE